MNLTLKHVAWCFGALIGGIGGALLSPAFVAGSFVFVGSFAAILAAIGFKQYVIAALLYGLALLLFWKIFKRDRL